MGDKFGQLKVTVVKGKRLVIRDFKSSDPYVILKLGNQYAGFILSGVGVAPSSFCPSREIFPLLPPDV